MPHDFNTRYLLHKLDEPKSALTHFLAEQAIVLVARERTQPGTEDHGLVGALTAQNADDCLGQL